MSQDKSESDHLTWQVLQDSDLALALFDRQGNCRLLTEQARALLGDHPRLASLLPVRLAEQETPGPIHHCHFDRTLTRNGEPHPHRFTLQPYDTGRPDGDRLLLIDPIDSEEEMRHQLVESARLHRRLFQHNPAIMLLVDPESGRFFDVNLAACRLYGWSREQMLQMGASDLNTQPAGELKQAMQSALKEQRHYFYVTHRLASGELREVEIHSGPVNIGERTLLCTSVHDISERNQLIRELGRQDRRYRSIINTAAEGFWLIDQQARTLEVNQSLSRMLGYTPEQMLGRTPMEFVDDENRRIFEQQIGRREQVENRQYEITLTRSDGSPLHTYFTTSTLRDEEGSMVGSFAFITDMTDHINAERALRASEERFRNSFEHSALASALIGLDGRILEVNPEAERVLGASLEEIDELDVRELVPANEARRLSRQALQLALGRIDHMRCEMSFLRRDGTLRQGELTLALVRDTRGEGINFAAQLLDITERKESELRLKRLSSAVENSGSSGIITDPQGVIEYVNPRFSEVTGYSPEEALGGTPALLRSERTDPAIYRELWDTINRGLEWRGEFFNRKKSGDTYWSLMSISPILDDRGSIINYVSVSEDVTELKEARARAERLSLYDPLTGLPNRRLFYERLGQALKGMSREPGRSLAVLFLDLDHFKDINDRHGHDAGDLLLTSVAHQLQKSIRQQDTACRLGGDEFAVLLPDVPHSEGAMRVAEQLLRALSTPVRLDSIQLTTGTSIGIAMAPDDGESVEALMKHADLAMYQAKAEGRNRYHFYTRAMQERLVQRLTLQDELRQAIQAGQLQLHSQPIVDLQHRRVAKLELLLRWVHPRLGLLTPDRFIPLAEQSGLIHSMGDWVMEQACLLARQLVSGDAHQLQLAINISPRQLESGDLPAKLEQLLNQHALPADCLVLELTESSLMKDVEATTRQLQQLKQLGVALAIDDFGTGYSSLGYLRRFPLDCLKIDRSFIQKLPAVEADREITSAIIAMASKLRLEVIAEGVSNTSQADFLLQSGCRYAQGELFTMPLPAEQLGRWLDDPCLPSICSPLLIK